MFFSPKIKEKEVPGIYTLIYTNEGEGDKKMDKHLIWFQRHELMVLLRL